MLWIIIFDSTCFHIKNYGDPMVLILINHKSNPVKTGDYFLQYKIKRIKEIKRKKRREEAD